MNFVPYLLPKRLLFCLFASLTFFVSPVLAQDAFSAAETAAEEVVVVRMYDVSDLVDAHQDRSFGGFLLPGVAAANEAGPAIMDGGGGGGGGGGGVFCVSPVGPLNSAQFGGGGGGGGWSNWSGPEQVDLLMQAIEDTVATEMWFDSRTMTRLQNILIISQTETVHQQIDAFLTLLRKTRDRSSAPITIKAIWLTIDETQFDSLEVSENQTVSRQALQSLLKEHSRRAQITCFDGQTVHVAAGNLKSTIESLIPVVGQVDWESQLPEAIAATSLKTPTGSTLEHPAVQPQKIPKHILAQVIDEGGGSVDQLDPPKSPSITESKIGYQPITRWINYGVVLQVAPKIGADDGKVLVDLQSIVVMPDRQRAIAINATSPLRVDRHDLRCQQFATSVGLKESTLTLVGGSTFPSETASNQQTYLILEVIVGEE